MSELKLRSVKLKKGVTADGLANVFSGLGGRNDARTANRYTYHRLSHYEVENAFRSSGLMRKICTIPASDVVREWRQWNGDDEQVAAIEAEEKRLDIRAKVKQAELLRALGGGALILGLTGDPSQPAPEQSPVAFVNVVSRYHLHFDKLGDNPLEDDFEMPVMYKLDTKSSGQVNIHPSRIIPFRSDPLPRIHGGSNSYDDFWGDSKVEQVLDAVQDCDTARAAFAALIVKARNIRVGIPELSTMVSTPEGEAQMMRRLQLFQQAESIYQATVYDSGYDGKGAEAIDDATYSFTGLKDVMNAYGEWASAISDIPSTRLLGRAPEGMNSSGESQQADWNKKIRAMQELETGPCLDKLDRYLTNGDISYEWRPLDTPSQKEKAETFKTEMDAVVALVNTGAIPDMALNEAIQSLLVERGYLPSLESSLKKYPNVERLGLDPDGDDDDDLLGPLPPRPNNGV